VNEEQQRVLNVLQQELMAYGFLVTHTLIFGPGGVLVRIMLDYQDLRKELLVLPSGQII